MADYLKGIDLSHHNGSVNFQKLAEEGNTFVILKIGGSDAGLYKDSKFDQYYRKAKTAGINVGAYYYVGKDIKNNYAAVLDHIRTLLESVQLEYPFYLDIESTTEAGKIDTTTRAVFILRELEKLKYFVGVYASDISGFKEKLNLNSLQDFTLWVARYGKEPQYVKNWDIWQYTEKGISASTMSNVDKDYAKRDFSKIIVTKHFNNF